MQSLPLTKNTNFKIILLNVLMRVTEFTAVSSELIIKIELKINVLSLSCNFFSFAFSSWLLNWCPRQFHTQSKCPVCVPIAPAPESHKLQRKHWRRKLGMPWRTSAQPHCPTNSNSNSAKCQILSHWLWGSFPNVWLVNMWSRKIELCD
jgi:hypothetical protein